MTCSGPFALDKVRKRLGVTRASLGSLSERTIEADRCYILDCGYISYRLWNAINVAGSSYVCRSSDRTLATVTQANELTDADRAASGAATISSIRGVRCCADGGRRARLIREGKARGYPCR